MQRHDNLIGLRRRGEEPRPLLQQLAALYDDVASAVSALDRVAYRVSQAQLGNDRRKARALLAPSFEAASHPVDSLAAPSVAQRGGHRGFGNMRPRRLRADEQVQIPLLAVEGA